MLHVTLLGSIGSSVMDCGEAVGVMGGRPVHKMTRFLLLTSSTGFHTH
jgi:hypothetical protein